LVTGAENEIPFDEAMGKGIIDQVKTGIAQKLDAGDSKFVVKLKPEGLGEIAVEMAQKSGKIVLNIIASSAQTEKLLTRELTGLRDSLRLYNAEIRQVTSAETDPDAFSYFSNQDTPGYSQGRLDQWQYAGEQQRSFAAWQNVSETGPDSDEAEPAYRSVNSLLNRYV
jgi:flagellar hook-length control protein FliK